MHRGQGENPHAHLMISERANDGIERSREQWFKRYNSKDPEKGRARKSMATRPKDWLEQTRKDWADHANQALARVGSRVCTLGRITSPEPSAGWCWSGPDRGWSR